MLEVHKVHKGYRAGRGLLGDVKKFVKSKVGQPSVDHINWERLKNAGIQVSINSLGDRISDLNTLRRELQFGEINRLSERMINSNKNPHDGDIVLNDGKIPSNRIITVNETEVKGLRSVTAILQERLYTRDILRISLTKSTNNGRLVSELMHFYYDDLTDAKADFSLIYYAQFEIVSITMKNGGGETETHYFNKKGIQISENGLPEALKTDPPDGI